MKLAIYTCITNNYDSILPMARQNPDVDFICFTDNPLFQYQTTLWNIRPIPQELKGLTSVKQQRIIKACPHKYLLGYETSLWVDGNISIISNIEKFLQVYDLEKYPIWSRKHPNRKCIYEEGEAVIKLKKDIPDNVRPQLDEYKLEGFPANFGLHETCVLYRRHVDKDCQRFGNIWASEILKHSHRDQLSFDYCSWKTKVPVGELKIGNLLKDGNFRWRKHGK